jgi:hypothetical protein
MDHDVLTMLVRFLKYAGVLAYGAGLGIGLWVTEPQLRKRVVHRFASPALMLIWAMGYLLTLIRGVALSEPWVVGGFCASLAGHVLLVRSTGAPAVSSAQRLSVAASLALTLLLMTFRPTW